MQTSLEEWLSKGPYSLALCSHFFGFYSHTAIVEQLYKFGVKPTKITGTSAGALVGGALASGLEPADFKEILLSKTVHDYWDPKLGLGLLSGKKFYSQLRSMFVEDFAKASTPLSVGVAHLPFLKMKFLNTGDLPNAVLASCAVPFLFPPVKVEGQWYYDGGLLQKSGMCPLDQKERVLNIFLDSTDGLVHSLHRRKKTWSENHRVVLLPKAPRVNLRDLSTGRDAYTQTLQRAEALFQKKFNDQTLVL